MSTQDPLRPIMNLERKANEIVERCFYARSNFIRENGKDPNRFFINHDDYYKLKSFSYDVLQPDYLEHDKPRLFNIVIERIDGDEIYCGYVIEA